MRRNKDEGDKGLKGMSTGGSQAAENGNKGEDSGDKQAYSTQPEITDAGV